MLYCWCASSSLEPGFHSWIDSQQYLAARLGSQSRLYSKVSVENVSVTWATRAYFDVDLWVYLNITRKIEESIGNRGV